MAWTLWLGKNTRSCTHGTKLREIEIRKFERNMFKLRNMSKAPFTRHQTNFYQHNYWCGYGLRLHGNTISGQVFDHLSVQVFNLLRNRTSAGQMFVRYRVNANRNKYLYGFVNKVPSNTRDNPQYAEQMPKELISTDPNDQSAPCKRRANGAKYLYQCKKLSG